VLSHLSTCNVQHVDIKINAKYANYNLGLKNQPQAKQQFSHGEVRRLIWNPFSLTQSELEFIVKNLRRRFWFAPAGLGRQINKLQRQPR
jgi:hypothetical protein